MRPPFSVRNLRWCRSPQVLGALWASLRAAQVAAAHDLVPLEDTARPVPGHHHCHALGDTGAHEIAYAGAPQVVRYVAETAGGA